MRAVLIVVGLSALLCGCRKEPSFDERYAETQKEIGQRAIEIDRDLAETRPGQKSVDSSANEVHPPTL